MEARRIQRPIHLLGFARSGTTMLGRVFENHPDVALFNEPRTIWSLGNAYLPDDVLGPEHLTPDIARRIDQAFAEGMERKGGVRFVEKTPSNCLRIPFLAALYPDGLYVHIVRDGRAVVRSLLLESARTPRARRIRKRLRETPISAWPAFLPTAALTVWRTRVLRKPPAFWGPRPPGWREWTALPPHVRAARQWRVCVETAMREGAALAPERYMEIRYEAFVQEPLEWTRRIFEFIGLRPAAESTAFLEAEVRGPRSAGAGSPLTPAQEAEAEAEMRPLLDRLGY